jgi:hypothetical protein
VQASFAAFALLPRRGSPKRCPTESSSGPKWPVQRLKSEILDQVRPHLKRVCATILNHGTGDLGSIYSGGELVIIKGFGCMFAGLDCNCPLIGYFGSGTGGGFGAAMSAHRTNTDWPVRSRSSSFTNTSSTSRTPGLGSDAQLGLHGKSEMTQLKAGELICRMQGYNEPERQVH